MLITYKYWSVGLPSVTSWKKIVDWTGSLRTVYHQLRFNRKLAGIAWDMKCECSKKTGRGRCSFNTNSVTAFTFLSVADGRRSERLKGKKQTSKLSILFTKAKKEIIILLYMYLAELVFSWFYQAEAGCHSSTEDSYLTFNINTAFVPGLNNTLKRF